MAAKKASSDYDEQHNQLNKIESKKKNVWRTVCIGCGAVSGISVPALIINVMLHSSPVIQWTLAVLVVVFGLMAVYCIYKLMELKELQVRKDIELMERNNDSNQSQKELTNEREFILREREEEHRHEERMELLRTLQLNPDMAPEIVKTVYLEGTNNRKVYNVSTHKNGEIIQMPTNDRKE